MDKPQKSNSKPFTDAKAYTAGLGPRERERYKEKLQFVGGADPYELAPSSWSNDKPEILPSIAYPDIVNYLVFSPSPYTAEDLKSYKGLDAYNQMVCGWVRELQYQVINNRCVVKAKVLHSQSIRETPLDPWIITEKSGRILGAHCTCKAGLGETCTHVAALLFLIEETVKLRDSKTVTQEKAYWLLPTALSKVEYRECRKIDFTVAKRSQVKKLAKMKCATHGQSVEELSASNFSTVAAGKTQQPTNDELSSLFSALSTTGSKSAILSLIEPYSDSFVPKVIGENFPPVLTELRNDEAVHMDYSDLLDMCKNVETSVSEEQAKAVEAATKDQASSKLWFRFRAGRITASKMKTACCTDPKQPSQSFIKSVCYPESYKLTSKATTWGCNHEKFARDMFLDLHKKSHDNVKVHNTGFFINPSVPFLGASPDGIVSCDCCGVSVIEVKCPFCVKSDKLDSVSYLEKDSEGKLTLNRNHQYFYQVQTQLGVCKLESAYFVVWTEKDLHVEQILFDEGFWDMICQKSKHIFDTAIMPELVGKFYTRLSSTMANVSSQPGVSASAESHGSGCAASASSQEQTWCFCGQGEFGKMILCDNTKCHIKWFHFSCINVKVAPKGKWYCAECQKLPQFLSKK